MEIFHYKYKLKNMKNIVIVGAGELGKEVVWLIEDINKNIPTYLILGFLDDDYAKLGKEFFGYKVLGGIDMLNRLKKNTPLGAVIAIREGSIRKRIVEEQQEFVAWESIVHPTAIIASTSIIGEGSIIFPQVTVSVDSKLGKFGIYCMNSIIGNDCRLGDYVSILPGAYISEHSVIEDECILGARSCVYPHTTVGSGYEVALGAIVR